MKLSIKMILGSVAMMCLASPVFADQKGRDYETFHNKISAIKAQCDDMSACGNISTQVIFDQEQTVNEIDCSLSGELMLIVHDQVNVWGDTILEGDFEVAEKARIDRVEAIYEGQNLIAYHITYSDKAVDTVNKIEGRIIESSYVSAGLTSWFRDQEHFASFGEL